MSEDFLRRAQATGAALIGFGYFLPWASILAPYGSIQIRGLYVDYAWVLLVLAVFHLLAQFIHHHWGVLGLPESWQRHVTSSLRFLPFVLIVFFTWYGVSFALSAHSAATSGNATLFGTEVTSAARAGLDYGYWIGLCGSVVLLLSVGLTVKQSRNFATLALVSVAATAGIAFGFSLPSKQVRARMPATTTNSSRSEEATSATEAPPVEPDLDPSPYVQVVSINGTHSSKNYAASRFSDTATVSVVFKNVSDRTIVGLRGRLSVLDGFGKEVYGFGFRDDDKLLPGKESRRGSGYQFEDNQFIDDQPYDKILPLIVGGTAKYHARVTRIAFEDGTVLPSSEGK